MNGCGGILNAAESPNVGASAKRFNKICSGAPWITVINVLWWGRSPSHQLDNLTGVSLPFLRECH